MKATISTFLVLTSLFAVGCSAPTPTKAPEETQTTTTLPEKSMKTTPEPGDTIATLTTTKGTVKMLLYTDLAPITTENFIELADDGKFDGVIFHRVINDFMIQTGDFEFANGTGGYTFKGPGTKLQDEFSDELRHDRGAVSMANAGFPNSGASQFFIVQKEGGTHWLDGLHAVFGFVYEGMDVVDEIAGAEVGPNDLPLEEIKIEKVEIGNYQ